MPPLTTRTFETSPTETRPPAAQGTQTPDPRPVALADDDLRLQAWCVENLDCLLPVLLASDPPTPPEIASGAILLLRTLYELAGSHDAAAGRLWCALSVRKLGIRLTKDKKTIEAWWDACLRHDLGLEGPDPRHAQRLRRRPRWDVIVPQMRAAARAGKIPPEPLFTEAVETGGTIPPVLTGPVQSPDIKPGEPLPRFGEKSSFFNQNFGGGVRGGTPLKGGSPLTPTAPPENRPSDWTGPIETGGTTPPVSELQPASEVQLLLEFAEDADARAQRKLDNLVDGQARTLSLLERIAQFLFTPATTATSTRRTAKPDSRTPRSIHSQVRDYGPEMPRELQALAEGIIAAMTDDEVLTLARSTREHVDQTSGNEVPAGWLRRHPAPEMKRKIIAERKR